MSSVSGVGGGRGRGHAWGETRVKAAHGLKAALRSVTGQSVGRQHAVNGCKH